MKKHKQRSNCSARVIPYFFDQNGQIILIMVKIKGYGDWTAMGGKCTEVTGNCPSHQNRKLINCLMRELVEETHFAITGEDININSCISFNYIDTHGRHNNIRFSELKTDPSTIREVFHDQQLINIISKLPDSRSYFESEDISLISLNSKFLDYSKNVHNRLKPMDQKIDESILEGLYSAFKTTQPEILVAQIEDLIRKCHKYQ